MSYGKVSGMLVVLTALVGVSFCQGGPVIERALTIGEMQQIVGGATFDGACCKEIPACVSKSAYVSCDNLEIAPCAKAVIVERAGDNNEQCFTDPKNPNAECEQDDDKHICSTSWACIYMDNKCIKNTGGETGPARTMGSMRRMGNKLVSCQKHREIRGKTSQPFSAE